MMCSAFRPFLLGLLLLSLGLSAASAAQEPGSGEPAFVTQPPANDNFASATVLTSDSGTVTGTNDWATAETGEPSIPHYASTARKTVWWVWTASADGNVTFNTIGASFDTVLCVFTGSSVNALTFVAGNDDVSYPSIAQSRVVFAATAGTTYRISVDGYSGVTGSILLSWNPAPPAPANDTFAHATPISGASGLTTATNAWAMCEADDPIVANRQGGASIWWAWTAPADGYYRFSATSRVFLPLIGAYQGASLPTLTERASNFAGNFTCPIVFPATHGQVYYIIMDGPTGSQSDNFVLSWAPVTPPNDNFVNAIDLPGTSGTAYGSNVGATKETGEPIHAGNTGGASVWWSWTAPTTGSMTIDNYGSDFGTILAVYTGTAVGILGQVAAQPNLSYPTQCQVNFPTQPGATYNIAVDGYLGQTGAIVLNYALDSTTRTLDYSAGPHGRVDGDLHQVVTAGAGGTPVSATPTDAMYFFHRWSDGSRENPRTDTNVTTNVAVTAIFSRMYVVEFLTDDTPGSRIEGIPLQMVMGGDDSEPATAIAPPGYRLDRWTLFDETYSTFDRLVVPNVSNSMTLVAHFVPWTGYTTSRPGIVSVYTGGLQLIDPVTRSAQSAFFTTSTLGSAVAAAMTNDGREFVVGTMQGRVLFGDLTLPANPALAPTSATLPMPVSDIDLTPDGRYAVATNFAGAPFITVLDMTSRTVAQTYVTTDTMTAPGCAAVSSDGRTVLAVDTVRKRVDSYVLDPGTGMLTHVKAMDVAPFLPSTIAISPDGRTALACSAGVTSAGFTSGDPLAFRIDGPGDVTYVGPVLLPSDVYISGAVAFSRRSGDKAYCATIDYTDGQPSNAVKVLDVTGPGQVSFTGTSILLPGFSSIATTPGISTTAIDFSGRYLYVASPQMSEPSYVSVVDLQTNSVVGTIATVTGIPNARPVSVAFPSFDISHIAFATDGTPGASLTGATSQTVVAWTPTTTVTAVAPANYHFAQWTSDSLPPVTANPGSLRPFAAETTVTARFARDGGAVVIDVAPDNAPWILTDGDGQTHSGAGPATLPDVPTGSVSLAWLPFDGFTAPAAPASQSLSTGGTVTFTGAYTPLIATGTVGVYVNRPDAPWSFTDGAGGAHSGAGPTTVTLVPTGTVTLTWQPLAGYVAPSAPAPQTLAASGTAVFSGTYTAVADTGTVVVQVTPADAPWSIVDGSGSVRSGVGPTTATLIPAGSIALTWLHLPGYGAPADPAPQMLAVGGTVAFSGAYTLLPPVAAPYGIVASKGWFAGRVAVTCEPDPGATAYRVFRADTLAGSRTMLTDWQTSTTWYDTTAAEGQTYYYWMAAAANTAGLGAGPVGAPDQGWTAPAASFVVAHVGLDMQDEGAGHLTFVPSAADRAAGGKTPGISIKRLKPNAKIPTNPKPGYSYIMAAGCSQIDVAGALDTFYTDAPVGRLLVAGAAGTVSTKNALVRSIQADSVAAVRMTCSFDSLGDAQRYAETAIRTDGGADTPALQVSLTGIVLGDLFTGQNVKSISVASKKFRAATPSGSAVSLGGTGRVNPIRAEDAYSDFNLQAPVIAGVGAKGADVRSDLVQSGADLSKLTATALKLGGTAGSLGGMVGSADTSSTLVLTVTAPNIGAVTGAAGVHGSFMAGADGSGAPTYTGAIGAIATGPAGTITGDAFVKEDTIRFSPSAGDERNTMHVWTHDTPKP